MRRRRSPALEPRPFSGVVAASGGEWRGAPTLTVNPISVAASCAVLEPSTLAVGGDFGVLMGEKGGRRDSGWGLWCIDGGERREKGLWVGTLVY